MKTEWDTNWKTENGQESNWATDKTFADIVKLT